MRGNQDINPNVTSTTYKEISTAFRHTEFYVAAILPCLRQQCYSPQFDGRKK